MDVKITDRDSLLAWLKDQPDDLAQVIAHRSAARVLPRLRVAYDRADRLSDVAPRLTQQTFRLSCALRLVCVAPNAERRASAAAVNAATADAAAAGGANDYSATYADAYAAFAAYAAADEAAYAAYAAYSADYADIWDQITADAAQWQRDQDLQGLLTTPLWQGGMPDLARNDWADLQAYMIKDDPNWQFWIDFYQTILDGGAYGDDYITLLDDITQMPKDVWDQPAADINAIIAEKYAGYIRAQFSRPERIVFDADNATLSIHDLISIPDDIIANIKRKLKTQLIFYDERHRSGNQYAALADPFDYARKVLDDPNLPALDLFDEVEELSGQVARLLDKGELPNDAYIARISSDLAKSLADIIGHDDGVQDMVERRRNKQAKPPAQDSDAAKAIIGAMQEAVALSEGPLNQRMKEDLAAVDNWIKTEGEQRPTTQEQYRTASRMLEISAAVTEHFDIVTEKLSVWRKKTQPWLFWGGLVYAIYTYLGLGGS